MPAHLPGLRVLRGFEAAGRHLNFSRAADELGVTPAAISHHVKELEELFGVELISRAGRSMELTRSGTILHDATGEALAALARGTSRIRDAAGGNRLRVLASASIAAKWLVPRIGGFIALRPDIDVRLDISTHLRDFAPEDADVAIRWGQPSRPGLSCRRLFVNIVFPVCSPALLRSGSPPKAPRDLARHRLIHVAWKGQDRDRPDWGAWMRAAGAEYFDDGSGLHFDDSGPALQAAIDGQGVALADSPLVADDLAAGRLARPFEPAIETAPRHAYHIVTASEVAEDSPAAAFRDWVLSEAKKTSAAKSSETGC